MATIGRVNAPAARGAGAMGSAADRFLMNAMRFMGQPYKWGGGHGAPMRGPGPVDCSGLVQQAAQLAGVSLSGRARDMQAAVRPVSMNALKPGDLVFRGRPATHVGIYIGDGKVLHAPKTGDVVKITSASAFHSAGRPAAFEGTGGKPVAPVGPPAAPRPAPPRPVRPAMPAPPAPGPRPDTGVPSALDLPRAPLAPGDAVPAYAERFGRQGHVRNGADGSLLELARRAVAKAPELVGGALGQALAGSRLDPEAVKALQRFLEVKGYDVGDTGVDGMYGPRTHRAMKAFLDGAPPG